MGYLIGGGGRVGVVTVIGRGGGGGSGGTVGTVTGGGGSTGAGGTGTGTVTPAVDATVETVEAIGAGGGEVSCVGGGTLLGALGWTKPPARVAGAARRSFSWRTAMVLRSDRAGPAEALFCADGTSDAFA